MSHCFLVLSHTLHTEAAEDWTESVSTEISNTDISSNKLITMLEDIPLNQDHQEYFFYSSFSVVVIALYHPVNQSLSTIVMSTLW